MFNPYIILAVFLAIAGAGGGGYVKGKWDADRSAEVRELTEQRDSLKIALQVADDLANDNRAAAEANAQIAKENKAQIEEYEAALKKRGENSVCVITEEDMQFLSPRGPR